MNTSLMSTPQCSTIFPPSHRKISIPRTELPARRGQTERFARVPACHDPVLDHPAVGGVDELVERRLPVGERGIDHLGQLAEPLLGRRESRRRVVGDEVVRHQLVDHPDVPADEHLLGQATDDVGVSSHLFPSSLLVGPRPPAGAARGRYFEMELARVVRLHRAGVVSGIALEPATLRERFPAGGATERRVADHGDALDDAALVVVGHRVVLGAAVVPDTDRALAPQRTGTGTAVAPTTCRGSRAARRSRSVAPPPGAT